MNIEDQVVMIFTGVNAYLDKVVTSEISKFEKLFLDHMKGKHKNILDTIRNEGTLSKEHTKELHQILEEFIPSCGIQLKDK